MAESKAMQGFRLMKRLIATGHERDAAEILRLVNGTEADKAEARNLLKHLGITVDELRPPKPEEVP